MKQKFLIFVVMALTSLSFADKTVVNLGSTAVHTPLRRTVTYKNPNWFKPVQIEKVESSCSCLRILSYPSEVAAKSSVDITFELTPDKAGQLDYTLMVLTSSGDHRMFSLKVDVQPSDSQATSSSIALPSRAITLRDSSLYLTPTEIMAGPGFSFVDIRSKTEYQQCHIPGALNLFRPFVVTKSWLKVKPVVLVDGGWGDPALEETARSLRDSGFTSVHILYGGLAAWRAAGGTTEGVLPGLPSLSEVSAADWLQTRNFDDWIVLDVREAPEATLPESVSFKLPATEDQLKKELNDLLVKAGETPAIRTAGILPAQRDTKRILFVDADGTEGSSIRRMLSGWSGASVFYLQDGMVGMKKYEQMMTAAAGSRKETVSSRSQVAQVSGGSFSNGGIHPRKSGCGTCPH